MTTTGLRTETETANSFGLADVEAVLKGLRDHGATDAAELRFYLGGQGPTIMATWPQEVEDAGPVAPEPQAEPPVPMTPEAQQAAQEAAQPAPVAEPPVTIQPDGLVNETPAPEAQ